MLPEAQVSVRVRQGVAQLAAHRLWEPRVVSSSLTTLTKHFSMVSMAQLAALRVVIPAVAGSNPAGHPNVARLAELVDAIDSKSVVERREGSIPSSGTTWLGDQDMAMSDDACLEAAVIGRGLAQLAAGFDPACRRFKSCTPCHLARLAELVDARA